MASICVGLLVASSLGMAAVWLSGFCHATVQASAFTRRIPVSGLRAALAVIALAADAVWLVFASVAVYFAIVRAEGLATGRRWSATVLAAGILLPTASALTGWPLGPIF